MTIHPERDVNDDTNVIKIKLLVVEFSQKTSNVNDGARGKGRHLPKSLGDNFWLYTSLF